MLNDATIIYSNRNSVKLFPNSSNSNQINISLELENTHTIGVAIYDVSGKQVRSIQEKRYPGGQQSLFINTENLTNGVYMIHLNTSGGVLAQKWILMR